MGGSRLGATALLAPTLEVSIGQVTLGAAGTGHKSMVFSASPPAGMVYSGEGAAVVSTEFTVSAPVGLPMEPDGQVIFTPIPAQTLDLAGPARVEIKGSEGLEATEQTDGEPGNESAAPETGPGDSVSVPVFNTPRGRRHQIGQIVAGALRFFRLRSRAAGPTASGGNASGDLKSGKQSRLNRQSPGPAAAEDKTAGSGSGVMVAVPEADPPSKGKTPWYRRWGPLALGGRPLQFIGAVLIAQVGMEAMGAVMPIMAQVALGDFSWNAYVAIASALAQMVGRQVGPLLTRRHRGEKLYVGALGMRAFFIGALVAAYLAGWLGAPTGLSWMPLWGIPILIGLNLGFGFVSGLASTAETIAPNSWINREDSDKLESYFTWQQLAQRIVQIAAPLAVTAWIAMRGTFLDMLILIPISMLLAAAVAFFIPNERGQRSVQMKTIPEMTQEKVHPLARGWRAIKPDPVLKLAVAGFVIVTMIVPLLAQFFASAYASGLLVWGMEQGAAWVPESLSGLEGVAHQKGLGTAMAPYQGGITSMFALGGLIGLALMLIEKAVRRAKFGGDSGAESKRFDRLTMFAWTLAGGITLSAFVSFWFPLAPLGAWSLPAFAMIAFGLPNVGATLKLQMLLTKRVRNSADVPFALGFMLTASLFASSLAFILLKFLFGYLDVWVAFGAIAFASLALSAAMTAISWRLNTLLKRED